MHESRDGPRAVHNTRIRAMNEFQSSASVLQQGKDHVAQKTKSYMIEPYRGDETKSKASKSVRQRKQPVKDQQSRRSSNRYSKADKEIISIVQHEERIPGTIGGIPDAFKPSLSPKPGVKIQKKQSQSSKRDDYSIKYSKADDYSVKSSRRDDYSMKSSKIDDYSMKSGIEADLYSDQYSISNKETPVPRVRQDILKIRHRETGQSSRPDNSELRSLKQETPSSLLASYRKEKSTPAEQRSLAGNQEKLGRKSAVL